jgi:hypothetical protein
MITDDIASLYNPEKEKEQEQKKTGIGNVKLLHHYFVQYVQWWVHLFSCNIILSFMIKDAVVVIRL